MNMRPIWIVIVIVLLLGIGFLVFAANDENAEPVLPSAVVETSSDTAPPSTNPTPVTVTYDGSSFSPAEIRVPAGTTVTWVNSSSERMWVGVDEHPTHTEYDGTSTSEHCANGTATSPSVFDQCGAGSQYSFTFTKTGTWDYHNHANSSAGGTVVVE